MPLDYQIQQAQFRVGLQEGEDPRALKLGTLLRAENLVWKKGGRLERRRGVDLVRSIPGAAHMIDLGGEIGYAFGKLVLDKDGGQIPGYYSPIEIDRVSESRPARGVYGARVARTDAHEIVVWSHGDPYSDSTGKNLFAQVTWPSGREAAAIPIVSDGSSQIPLEVYAFGSDYIVIAQSGTATGSITMYQVNPTANTVTTVGILLQGSFGVNGYSAARCCDAGGSVVILNTLHTSGAVMLDVFSAAGARIGSRQTVETGNAAAGCHCIGYDARFATNLVYLGWVLNGGAFHGCAFDISTATLGAVKTIHAAMAGLVVSINQVAISVTQDGTGLAAFDIHHASVNPPAATSTGVVTLPVDETCTPDETRKYATFGVEMVSEPIFFGTDMYLVCADNRFFANKRTTSTYLVKVPFETPTISASVSSDYSSYGDPCLIIAAHPHSYAAKIHHADGVCFGVGCVSRAVPIYQSDLPHYNRARFVIPFATQSGNQGVTLSGYRLWDIREANWTRNQGPVVNMGGDTVLRAGVLTACDKSFLFDYGFGSSPALVASAIAGGSVANGTYITAGSYEYLSKNLRYRSDLSNVVTVTTSAGVNTIKSAIMRAGPGNKQPSTGIGYGESAYPQTSVKTYRSTVGGSQLFKLTLEPASTMVLACACQSADVVIDTAADSSIGVSTLDAAVTLDSQPEAYTSGGVLGDIQPPYFYFFCSAIGRMWGVQPSSREVWFSKRFDDDFSTAPGFCTAFRLQFDFVVTGIGALDDRAVFFGEDEIAVVSGSGPSVTSAGNDFNPQRLQSDVGCIDPESIVTTPDGIIFRSRRGIMILTRGLSVEPLGRPIQDVSDTYPRHLSSALVAKDNEVRLAMASEDLSDGVVAVYNYEQKQWTTFLYPFVVKQIVTIDGDVYLMSKDGDVYQESDETGLDAGTWTPYGFGTAWISAAGPIGFQSVRRFALLGETFSDHHLRVSVYHDGEETPSRVIEVESLEMLTSIRSMNDMQFHVGKRAKCNMMRFDLTIDPPDAGEMGSAKGVCFSAFAIEVGIKKGLRGRTKEIKR